MMGAAWQKFIHDMIKPGPMAAFIAWAAVTAGTAPV